MARTVPDIPRLTVVEQAALRAAVVELVRQWESGKPGPWVSDVEPDGECTIDGSVDLVALVRAILKAGSGT